MDDGTEAAREGRGVPWEAPASGRTLSLEGRLFNRVAYVFSSIY